MVTTNTKCTLVLVYRNTLSRFLFKLKTSSKTFQKWSYIETIYIIGPYNPLVRIIDLVSHFIYVVCVNSIHAWRYSLKSTVNDRFFEKLFMAIFWFFSRNLPGKNRLSNLFCILFWWLALLRQNENKCQMLTLQNVIKDSLSKTQTIRCWE